MLSVHCISDYLTYIIMFIVLKSPNCSKISTYGKPRPDQTNMSVVGKVFDTSRWALRLFGEGWHYCLTPPQKDINHGNHCPYSTFASTRTTVQLARTACCSTWRRTSGPWNAPPPPAIQNPGEGSSEGWDVQFHPSLSLHPYPPLSL